MTTALLQKLCGFRPSLVSHLMFSKILMAAAMLGGAGTMLSAGSAHAGLFNWGEIFPTIGIGVCNSPNSDAKCTFQDKVVSNFLTNYTLTATPTDTLGTLINFAEVDGIIDLNVTFLPGKSKGGSYTMSYDIEITDPAKSFKEIGLDSICVLPGQGPCSVQKEIAYYVNNVLQPINSSLTQTSVNGGPSGPAPIGAAVRKLRITDTWITTGDGSISSFSNNFTQSTNTVPAPLSVMGFGAAFAFSRRLRRRINASARTGV